MYLNSHDILKADSHRVSGVRLGIEHQQSLREEIERKYYPERYDFWPFGDPFINKRKREATKRRQQGQRQWYDED